MTRDNQTCSQEIRSLLHSKNQPLILAHIRPDGDAVASVLGMGLALQADGKKVQLVFPEGIPSKFKFLKGSDTVHTQIEPGYDLVIALDCSDQKRMGAEFADLTVDINIDHHITNENFGHQNLVLPEEPATSAILAQYLPQWGFPITPDMAETLLTGILTDTIGFRTSNVSANTLHLAANLIENGANLTELYEKALISQTFSASQLWGFSLSRLEKKGRIAWTSITLADRKQAGYPGRDDADLTNILSAIEEIDVSILFNEQNNCKIKVSWRSNADINVSVIAQRFGGGGHPPAAGAEITGGLEEVQNMVLEFTDSFLKEIQSKGENDYGK
jgi:phosphoesterase RecJ-like protein